MSREIHIGPVHFKMDLGKNPNKRAATAPANPGTAAATAPAMAPANALANPGTAAATAPAMAPAKAPAKTPARRRQSQGNRLLTGMLVGAALVGGGVVIDSQLRPNTIVVPGGQSSSSEQPLGSATPKPSDASASPDASPSQTTEGFGNTVVTVDGKSGTLVELFGGQADQWWPNQLPDGSTVPNSWVLVDRRSSDTELPGVDFRLPKGVVADLWVDNGGQKKAMKAMGADGAIVTGDYKVARATVYLKPSDYRTSLAGQWADSDGAKTILSEWEPIGTWPTPSADGASAGQRAYDSGTTMTGSDTNPTSADWMLPYEKSLNTSADVNRVHPLAGTTNGLKIEVGKKVKLSIGKGEKIDTPMGSYEGPWTGYVVTATIWKE